MKQDTLHLGFVVVEVGRSFKTFELNDGDVVYGGCPIGVRVVAHVLNLAIILEYHLQLGVAIRAHSNILRPSIFACNFLLNLFLRMMQNQISVVHYFYCFSQSLATQPLSFIKLSFDMRLKLEAKAVEVRA